MTVDSLTRHQARGRPRRNPDTISDRPGGWRRPQHLLRRTRPTPCEPNSTLPSQSCKPNSPALSTPPPGSPPQPCAPTWPPPTSSTVAYAARSPPWKPLSARHLGEQVLADLPTTDRIAIVADQQLEAKIDELTLLNNEQQAEIRRLKEDREGARDANRQKKCEPHTICASPSSKPRTRH